MVKNKTRASNSNVNVLFDLMVPVFNNVNFNIVAQQLITANAAG